MCVSAANQRKRTSVGGDTVWMQVKVTTPARVSEIFSDFTRNPWIQSRGVFCSVAMWSDQSVFWLEEMTFLSSFYWVWICCTMTICSIVELEPEECLQYSSAVPVQFQCLDTAGFFCALVDVHPKKHTQDNQLEKKNDALWCSPLPWSPIQYPIKLQLNQGIWNQIVRFLPRPSPTGH